MTIKEFIKLYYTGLRYDDLVGNKGWRRANLVRFVINIPIIVILGLFLHNQRLEVFIITLFLVVLLWFVGHVWVDRHS